MKAYYVDNAERCIFCNTYIPEGLQVCPICEKRLSDHIMEGVKEILEEAGKEN